MSSGVVRPPTCTCGITVTSATQSSILPAPRRGYSVTSTVSDPPVTTHDDTKGTEAEFTVRQYDPHRLWDDVTNAYLRWLEAGRPERDRFGLTVTPDRQDIWLDDPSNVLTRGEVA